MQQPDCYVNHKTHLHMQLQQQLRCHATGMGMQGRLVQSLPQFQVHACGKLS
jgi:hypothetical protein